MQPHKFILGVLLFSLFIFGGLFIMYGSAEDDNDGLFEVYNVEKDYIANDLENLTRSKQEEIYNITSDQQEDSKEEVDTGLGYSLFDLGPIRAMRRMYNFFSSVNKLIEGVAKVMHIPAFIIDAIITITLITVVFMVVYFVMKFQLRDD